MVGIIQLKVLRQLVELQLCHSAEIKSLIDRAWGVVHNKHKKAEMTPDKPPPEDPHSQENLQMIPVGQDKDRKRYWVVDGPCTFLRPSSPYDRVFACIYTAIIPSSLRHLADLVPPFCICNEADIVSWFKQIHHDYICQRTLGRSPPLFRRSRLHGMNTWHM